MLTMRFNGTTLQKFYKKFFNEKHKFQETS